jgi:conjugative transfer signal peptidase TraF
MASLRLGSGAFGGTISLTKRHGRRGPTPVILAWAVLPFGACATLAAVIPQPSVLWNGTPSEPTGLYVLTAAAPAPGRIIAFHTPARAFPYADARMGYLHSVPILKEVAAGEGDVVCTRAGALSINGRWRAPVLDRDPRGKQLPQWRGCRALGKGEFFVFSDRIPNSFDSRYYGPVTRAEIVGVFQPLLTTSDAPGAA